MKEVKKYLLIIAGWGLFFYLPFSIDWGTQNFCKINISVCGVVIIQKSVYSILQNVL